MISFKTLEEAQEARAEIKSLQKLIGILHNLNYLETEDNGDIKGRTEPAARGTTGYPW